MTENDKGHVIATKSQNYTDKKFQSPAQVIEARRTVRATKLNDSDPSI